MKLTPLPRTATLDQYETQVQALLAAFAAGDPAARQQVHQGHPEWWRLLPHEFAALPVGYVDIQRVVAWYYSFESWDALARWVAAVAQAGSPVALFEQAADAIATGDLSALQSLLQAHPFLVHARSLRSHHSQLLHYCGTNGIEGYRQVCPPNAVEVLKVLIAAGADVNARADMYGGSTTLGLVATSIHPAHAGILTQLLDVLIQAGATIDDPAAAVTSCLHNGRPEAAAYYVRHGALPDLEGAAGVGWLERVQYFFDGKGALQHGATRQQLALGFAWACAYGHDPVVTWLLDQGADPGSEADGLPALHWAIIGGHLRVVQLLAGRGASLSARNRYGGNAIDCTLWAVANSCEVYQWPATGVDYPAIFQCLLQAGAPIDAGTLRWLHTESRLAPATVEGLDSLFRQYGATT